MSGEALDKDRVDRMFAEVGDDTSRDGALGLSLDQVPAKVVRSLCGVVNFHFRKLKRGKSYCLLPLLLIGCILLLPNMN